MVGGFFLPSVPYLSLKGTGFVPTLAGQHVGLGIGQFILHVGYDVRIKIQGLMISLLRIY